MDIPKLASIAATLLERLRRPYIITGSMASATHGEPRYTNDLDIVVDLPPERVREFVAAFPPEEFYVSESAAFEAVRFRRMFNVIHIATGLKIDFFIAKETPFDRSRLNRCRFVEIAPQVMARFAAPEDVVIKKLHYYREGRSYKHLRDIAGILQVQGDGLDWPYLEHWIAEHALSQEWTELLALMETPRSSDWPFDDDPEPKRVADS